MTEATAVPDRWCCRCCRRWAAAGWSAARWRSPRRSPRPAASRWSPAPAAGWLPPIERAGGRHITLPLTPQPAGDLAQRGAAGSADPRRAVDIVHARSRAPAWSAWLAARRTGAHFVTTYHGAYGEDLPFKRRYNAVMARGERVIADQPLHRRPDRARATASTPARIRVIPRGVDPGGVRSRRRRPDACVAAGARAGGCRTARPSVMLPGRLTRWKGQDVLIEALARWRAAMPVGVLVGRRPGPPPLRARLVALAERSASPTGARWSAIATTCRPR